MIPHIILSVQLLTSTLALPPLAGALPLLVGALLLLVGALPLLIRALPLLAGVEAHPLMLRLPGHLHAPSQFAQRASMLKKAGKATCGLWKLFDVKDAGLQYLQRIQHLHLAPPSSALMMALLSIDDDPPQHL
jgi:hypothetical protein